MWLLSLLHLFWGVGGIQYSHELQGSILQFASKGEQIPPITPKYPQKHPPNGDRGH